MQKVLNIIDTAIQTGILQTFTRLLEGSELERELRTFTCYTLFAPADEAFAYLAPQKINQLLQAERTGVLTDVLAYHAVPGKIMAVDLTKLTRAKTVYGEELTIVNSGELRIDGARVIHPDIEARNGVIHVIDRILVPVKAARTVSA